MNNLTAQEIKDVFESTPFSPDATTQENIEHLNLMLKFKIAEKNGDKYYGSNEALFDPTAGEKYESQSFLIAKCLVELNNL